MTWFQLYAVFGGPLLVLGVAAGLYWWTGRVDRR
jgi:hypothetical protein